MASTLRLKRGATAASDAFTGQSGEVTVNSTTNAIVVHDGSTAGGFPQMRADGANSQISLGLVSIDYYETAGNHTWSRPSGVNYILVEIQGAGGAGGGGSNGWTNTWTPGAGGGAGGYIKFWYPLNAGISSFSLVVGAGGIGGLSNGPAGGSSSFGNFASGNGGGGGIGTAPIDYPGPGIGGSGGTQPGAVSGLTLVPGQDGTRGFLVTTNNYSFQGAGGNSFLGKGGRLGGIGVDGVKGGGGSGAHSSNWGGDGGDGLVIVWGYK